LGGGESALDKERPSFLKKRSKRLLYRCRGSLRKRIHHHKSFLVLFFKKELLPFFLSDRVHMTQDEITAWALRNGWQIIGGHPSLTKPSSSKEAIVRLVLKTTVVHLEAKKPAGKWEKITGQSYEHIVADDETGMPGGLGLETISGIRMLMQANRDRQVFSR
jgi:hypothetical protein